MDKNARVQSCTYATRRDTLTRSCNRRLVSLLSLSHSFTHSFTLPLSLFLSFTLSLIRHLVLTKGFETVRISTRSIFNLVVTEKQISPAILIIIRDIIALQHQVLNLVEIIPISIFAVTLIADRYLISRLTSR